MTKILVRSPNWLGDQVLAYPFFFYLRRAFPDARITAACVPWVEDLQYRDLVDDVFLLPRPITPSWRSKLRAVEEAATELRAKGHWDLAFALPNSFSAAWLLYRAGAKRRVGYDTEMRRLILTDARRWDPSPSIHRAQAYVDLLPSEARPSRPVREFWGLPPENELDEGTPGELERFDPDRSWHPGGPSEEMIEVPDAPYFLIAPGSAAESRRWPVESFAALASLLTREKGWTGIVVGGAAEVALGARLASGAEARLKDWTGRGGVADLSRLFQNAKLTITNDSGLAHVASLCGSPVHIVWGAGDPRRTQPLGPGPVGITMNPVDCWPCERNTCMQPPEKRLQCLRGIRPEAVLHEIQGGNRTGQPD